MVSLTENIGLDASAALVPFLFFFDRRFFILGGGAHFYDAAMGFVSFLVGASPDGLGVFCSTSLAALSVSLISKRFYELWVFIPFLMKPLYALLPPLPLLRDFSNY